MFSLRQIFPNYALIKRDLSADIEEDEIREFLREIVDEVNENMPSYKRVKRIGIRREEFIKTTVRKIKRYEKENFKSDF